MSIAPAGSLRNKSIVFASSCKGSANACAACF